MEQSLLESLLLVQQTSRVSFTGLRYQVMNVQDFIRNKLYSCHMIVSFLIPLLVLCALRTNSFESTSDVNSSSHYFPESIPYYEVRRDIFSGELVSRGRLKLINYSASDDWFPKNTAEQKAKMVKFKEFERHLQCSSPEPDMDGSQGGWSMVKMAPPTKMSLELICAWAESKCHPWIECRNHAASFRKGGYDKGMDDLDRVWGMFRGALLLRVIDNEVYYDWPWGIDRFRNREEHYSNLHIDHFAMLEVVLRTVSDIGDSVFFFGGERAFLRWNVPFPTFSFAPTPEYADYPFPWRESYEIEVEYDAEAERHSNYSDEFFKRGYTPWELRQPKAAFFASFQYTRQLVYDSAALRPDLFDVSFAPGNPMRPWNPISDEPEGEGHRDTSEFKMERNHAGFLQPLLQFGDGRRYTPHHYKYVVVPVGTAGLSSSGRLAGLLAHSGAVVLLQEKGFSYHFSARLQPWVHYVPLSYSMADLIDKVTWLREHDEMARQIVRNAENFAQSYLRLEDHLCYVASALHMISSLENTTDVLEGFSPRLIHRNQRRTRRKSRR